MNPPTSIHDAKTLPEAEGPPILQLIVDSLSDLQAGMEIGDRLKRLGAIPESEFLGALPNDNARKAFWINAYNVFNLAAMRKDLPKTDQQKWVHFSSRKHLVAGIAFSLNDIEHGILRRSRFWWSRGWLRNPFPRTRTRKLQLNRLDPRVHFALNCGANSCPAIRFYSPRGIEQELEAATEAFFQLEVHAERNTIWVSSLFKMYIGDFGGMAGLRKWLEKYRPDLGTTSQRIRFLKYDWTPHLQKFSDG